MPIMRGLSQDIRLAFRSMRAAPVLTAVALASLALAIGANTAVFSILNSLLVRELPVSRPEQLVHLTDSVRREDGSIRVRAWSYPVWDAIREAKLFEAATAWSFARFDLAQGGESRFVAGIWADGNFFDTLGVRAVAGRTFTVADDQRGGGPDGPVAVLGYQYWQRAYGGSTTAIGQLLRLNGVPFTIVGVTPPRFFGLEVGRTFDVIVPVRTEALLRGDASILGTAASNFLSLMARLAPNDTPEAAATRFRAAQPGIRAAALAGDPSEREFAATFLQSPFTLLPAATGFSNLRTVYREPLFFIAVVVALVLLVGCVNITNLLVARSIARRYQMAVQAAMGASRWRLARQHLVESGIMAGIGALAGLLVAWYAGRFLVQQLSTPATPVFLDLTLDGTVLGFTVALTVLTTLFFGTAPAFGVSAIRPVAALGGSGRTTTDGRRNRLMEGLVVAQVAFSVLLLVGAAVFLRSFAALAMRPLGYEPDRALVVTMNSPDTPTDPAHNALMYEGIREAMQSIPDVESAAVSFQTPAGGGGFTPAIEVASGAERRRAEANTDVFGNIVSPDWFRTFGTPLVSGRDITVSDARGTPRVVLVNETFARRFVPGRSPIGADVTVYPGTPRARQMQVVGVVADAVYSFSPRADVAAMWFAPLAQFDVFSPTAALSVRARSGRVESLAPRIADAVRALDPRVSVTFRPVTDQRRAALTPDRIMAQLAGFFGGLALLLSALGMYGVTAYALSCRRGEIGIRLALGALPRQMVRMILTRISALTLAGVAIGLGSSVWASRFIASLVYGASPRAPLTVLAASVLLIAVAMAAGWAAARQAARIDPGGLLRAG
jgi:putative ABC transport system permease protein